MSLKNILSERINLKEVEVLVQEIKQCNEKKHEIYLLIFDQNDKIAYQAAWVLTHLAVADSKFLNSRQNKLINEVMTSKHGGKKRLILTLLYKQNFQSPLRVDFLDFCFEQMRSAKERPAIQSLCMKIAYKLVRPIPELRHELESLIEMMDMHLDPAILASKKKVLEAIRREKSIE